MEQKFHNIWNKCFTIYETNRTCAVILYPHLIQKRKVTGRIKYPAKVILAFSRTIQKFLLYLFKRQLYGRNI